MVNVSKNGGVLALMTLVTLFFRDSKSTKDHVKLGN